MRHAADVLDFGQQVIDSASVMLGGRAPAIHADSRLCRCCGERRPRFLYRGVVKADRDHNLCFECFRAEVNRLRARRMSGVRSWVPPASPLPSASKMIGDREGLRAELRLRLRRAQISARHALAAPDAEPVAEPLAS